MRLVPSQLVLPVFALKDLRVNDLPNGAEAFFDASGRAYLSLPKPVKKIQVPPGFLFPSAFREIPFQWLGAGGGTGEASSGARSSRLMTSSEESSPIGRVSYFTRGNFSEAEEKNRRLVAKFRELREEASVANGLKFARAFRFFGDFARSEEILLKILERPRLDRRAKGAVLYDLAVTLRGKRDLDGALQRVNEALFFRPDSTSYLCEKGIILRAKGDMRGSIACLSEVIQQDFRNSWYYCEMALTLLECARRVKGNDAEIAHCHFLALQNIDESIKLNPSHPRHYCEKAAILSEMGRLQDALREIDKAIEIDPTHPRHHQVKEEIRNLISGQGL
jgi:tetratricopeptide (TPR) repeat protein